jgi:glycosyltransferase involved in cell wall biosynthesis
MNELMFRASVKRVAKRMGIGAEPVLWLNPHYAVHMVGRMGESAVVYDVTDDWTEMTQSPTLARRVDRQDAELCAKADAVIVCSQRLAELKRERSSAVHLIPNGVDAEHYANVLSQVVGEGNGESELPKVAREWRRPVLGYTGTVHPDRVDVELVRKVAQNWEGSVVLVGPDHLRDEDKARIDLPNVHRVGAVKYAEIPGVMRAFDVCMVPHRMTAFTESLNPIKLWEYLAAGKPIVSTDVAGFRDYPKLVRLAKTADEFLAAAHAAVEEGGTEQGKALAEQRRAVARENSWAQRVDEIERVIEAAIERRKLAEGSVPMVGLMKEASQAMHVS